jgi:hypothetical protein
LHKKFKNVDIWILTIIILIWLIMLLFFEIIVIYVWSLTNNKISNYLSYSLSHLFFTFNCVFKWLSFQILLALYFPLQFLSWFFRHMTLGSLRNFVWHIYQSKFLCIPYNFKEFPNIELKFEIWISLNRHVGKLEVAQESHKLAHWTNLEM